MKRLTLDQTWTECLRMWRWIADQRRKGTKSIVFELKTIWLERHGYGIDDGSDNPDVLSDCFFCEYNRGKAGCCQQCPGVLVDPTFDCENTPAFNRDPIGFYNRLRRLYRVYLKSKKAT